MPEDNRWYPHRDYAGEPMARGEFRDRQPTEPSEIAKRNAALWAIERFCDAEGIECPPLNEHVELTPLGAHACGGALKVVQFRGQVGPDGPIFGIGYEQSLRAIA